LFCNTFLSILAGLLGNGGTCHGPCTSSSLGWQCLWRGCFCQTEPEKACQGLVWLSQRSELCSGIEDITGTWASWAYAWALVFPAAGGLAGIIHGTLHANWRHVRDSAGGFLAGIVMFLVLGFVFELWLGFEGFGLARLASLIPKWIPGATLLLVGLIVLLAGVAGKREPLRSERDQQQAEYRDGFPAPTQAPGVSSQPTRMEPSFLRIRRDPTRGSLSRSQSLRSRCVRLGLEPFSQQAGQSVECNDGFGTACVSSCVQRIQECEDGLVFPHNQGGGSGVGKARRGIANDGCSLVI